MEPRKHMKRMPQKNTLGETVFTLLLCASLSAKHLALVSSVNPHDKPMKSIISPNL